MMVRKRFSGGGYNKIFAILIIFLSVSNSLSAVESKGVSEQSPYEIFPLRYISSEQGKGYLADIGIKTVSQIPGSNALLVTAHTDELAKAKAVLNVVDNSESFVVKAILPVSAAVNMPDNEQIAARVGNITIGSFSNPPRNQTGAKAIIDIHNNAVIIVVPAGLLESVVSAIGPVQDTKLTVQNATQDNLQSLCLTTEPPRPKAFVSENPGIDYLSQEKMLTVPNTIAAEVQADQIPDQNDNQPVTLQLSAVEQPGEPTGVVSGEEVVNLNLTENTKLTIVEFLGLIGPYLQMDFMYDEKDLIGEVTFNPHGKFSGPIKVKDLYTLLETVLKFRNLAMTRGTGNLVTIAPVANALEIDPTLMEDALTGVERGDGIVIRVFELKYITPSSAISLLEAMKLSIAPPISEGKSLIVTGYSHRMPRIEKLLDMVDKPGEPRKFRSKQLRYTMAQTLAPKVQTLAEQLGTISVTIAAAAPEPTPTTPSPRRAGETTTAYTARIRREQQIRAQRATAAQPSAEEQAQPGVYLDADERTNRILMIGVKDQLDTVVELIETLDVAQQDLRSLVPYKIIHVDAEDVKRKLEELGIIGASPESSSSTGSSDATEQPGTPAPQQRTSGGRRSPAAGTESNEEVTESLVEEPQVIVIEATNSLLVNATPEQHERIATIISYVDSETEVEEIPYKVYYLKNQGPDHLREVLLPFIEEIVETVRDQEDKIQEVKKKTEEKITIVSDPNTASLVVYANKKNQEWIGSLIMQLDKRRPQVLIDVTLVQISKTDLFNYDLNMLSSFPDLTNTSGLTGAIMGALDTEGNVVKDNHHPFPATSSGRDRFIDLQAKSGVGTGFYGDRHINLLLTAMQQKDYGRVLAKPKILVNDNEQGVISTIDKTYVTKQTGTIIEGNSTAVQTAVDYQDYPAGITLTIVPHISDSDLLRLDINLVRSDFGTITGDKPPDTTESNVETTVTVPDKSTIILGGMLKLNQSKGGTKVPILGDIPLIGGLFRSTSNSDLQRNLYVFVKAEIIRPLDEDDYARAELQKISDRSRDAFEQREVEFQKYQDWPGIKPQPIDPLKVLDTQ